MLLLLPADDDESTLFKPDERMRGLGRDDDDEAAEAWFFFVHFNATPP